MGGRTALACFVACLPVPLLTHISQPPHPLPLSLPLPFLQLSRLAVALFGMRALIENEERKEHSRWSLFFFSWNEFEESAQNERRLVVASQYHEGRQQVAGLALASASVRG